MTWERKKYEKAYPRTEDVFTSVSISMILNESLLSESVKKSCEFVEICVLKSNKYDYQTNEGSFWKGIETFKQIANNQKKVKTSIYNLKKLK